MKLAIAEEFLSIQGEGRYAGRPAYFLRLAGCNLLCGGTKEESQHLGESKWRCDTIPVWRKGKPESVEHILFRWQKSGLLDRFKRGVHLVITGGEPLLQQRYLKVLVRALWDEIEDIKIEIETNGTIDSELDHNQILIYNVSPKLQNSGEPLERRRLKIKQYSTVDMIFKFVVHDKTDLDEALQIIKDHDVPNQIVYLMPASSTKADIDKLSPLIAQFCIDHNFNFSPRLQLMIWDQATGV